MLRRRSRMFIYFILIYLLATGGVNHYINPMIYINNLVAKNNTTTCDFVCAENEIIISLAEKVVKKPYISFDVKELSQCSIEVELIDGVCEEIRLLEIDKGLNTIKLNRENSEVIKLKCTENINGTIQVEEVYQTEFPRVNIWKTIEIFFALWMLVLFWEIVQVIKNRYAK